jgi:hypothetical protein
MNMTEKDVEILDYIVAESLKFVCLHARDLKPLDNGFLSDIEESKESAYTYYFDILKEKNVVRVEKEYNGKTGIYPIDIKTKEFIRQGGFKAILDKQNTEKHRNIEIDELTLRKLRWDTKLSKWKVKTFWPVFIFGLVGFIFGVFNFIDNRYKTKSIEELQQDNRHSQTEVSKLRTLVLDQKNLDSLHSSKNPVAPLDRK